MCEKNINSLRLACPHNPGMCPDRELNQQPLSLQAGTQAIKPHQPGLDLSLKCTFIFFTSAIGSHFASILRVSKFHL